MAVRNWTSPGLVDSPPGSVRIHSPLDHSQIDHGIPFIQWIPISGRIRQRCVRTPSIRLASFQVHGSLGSTRVAWEMQPRFSGFSDGFELVWTCLCWCHCNFNSPMNAMLMRRSWLTRPWAARLGGLGALTAHFQSVETLTDFISIEPCLRPFDYWEFFQQSSCFKLANFMTLNRVRLDASGWYRRAPAASFSYGCRHEMKWNAIKLNWIGHFFLQEHDMENSNSTSQLDWFPENWKIVQQIDTGNRRLMRADQGKFRPAIVSHSPAMWVTRPSNSIPSPSTLISNWSSSFDPRVFHPFGWRFRHQMASIGIWSFDYKRKQKNPSKKEGEFVLL